MINPGRTLLVGAGGPIGRAVAEDLARAGWSVTATSRRSDTAALDVSDAAASERVLHAIRPRNVVYLVNPAADLLDDRDRRQTALEDLRRFVGLATTRGARRIVLASSAAVYGDRATLPLREDAALAGNSGYAIFKRTAEQIVAAEAESAVSLRIFNVYGPGCTASLVNRLAEGRTPTVYVSDRFVRDYVHVLDVAAAVRLALAAPHGSGAVNIGTGLATDNLSLLRHVDAQSYVPAATSPEWSYSVADVVRAREILGWVPGHSDVGAFLHRPF